jgi:transcriptional antiterminator
MNDFSAQQRAAIVVQMLIAGPQTARNMAEATGLSLRSIYYVLDNISLSVPITNSGGIWYMLTSEEHREIHHILRKLEEELESAKCGQAMAHPFKLADVARLVAIMRRFVVAPEPE